RRHDGAIAKATASARSMRLRKRRAIAYAVVWVGERLSPTAHPPLHAKQDLGLVFQRQAAEIKVLPGPHADPRQLLADPPILRQRRCELKSEIQTFEELRADGPRQSACSHALVAPEIRGNALG